MCREEEYPFILGKALPEDRFKGFFSNEWSSNERVGCSPQPLNFDHTVSDAEAHKS